MPTDQNIRSVTIEGGRTVFINVRDIRSFYNFESKLTIEMIDGTVYNVDSAPSVNTFYTNTFGLDPREVTVTNDPLETKEQLTSLTLTTSVVSVGTSDTLVLNANANRKFLLIQRGTTVGRVFVHFDSSAATATNGVLFRENAYFSFRYGEIYTGEIRAISVGSSKILYVTEGV